ncbi:HDOD domain-containing protein [Shewanella cyperi]|uniref:HDOD domain-containing protein n=2 Tax=Shewanella TaxID=22 RepID=A0A974XIK3_9GAMM|nr:MULTISPECIES: HDOD domain-containing protein [Shewanella]QSX29029.1 HDOD domain-containing protein [Shewanella cyperi]QSX36161.1 HDOD domain-containing protein [Shewanella sedimentimangrovi]
MKAQASSAKGVDYWTQRISEQEMPALCSTVKTLERLAKDDVSSMTILGRSIMHDNALTSRILRVANSATYNKGISQVTTVSRAAVVLGFDTIRNICITAKLLSSLLENKNLTPAVYQRLLKLMAKSFQAAMLARMMLSGYEEEIQEEAFIAALLYHLGESAFWSMGGELAIELDRQLEGVDDGLVALSRVRDLLGASFTQLTQGLARNWGLGEVLLKSLNNPDERTPEIRAIFLANKLSEALAEVRPDPVEMEKRIKQAADLLGIKPDEFRNQAFMCARSTHKLAEAYGAKVLVDFLPEPGKFLPPEEEEIQITIREPDLVLQLKKLKELTGFAVSKTEINQVMLTALEGILDGVGVDRCAVLLLSPSRKMLQPRIVLGENADDMKRDFVIELDEDNLFRQAVELKTPMWIDAPDSARWRMSIPESMRKRLSSKGFLMAPMVVENKVIGMFYADRGISDRSFTGEEFDSFTHFTQLANVCFSTSMRP